MSSPAKGVSQPCGWQIASSRDLFCDFGRKLGNLSLPVRNTVLCCHGRQHKVLMPPDGAFKTHTSLRETLNQADLDLPYFRTTEQNSPGLMQFATHKTPPPFAGELIAQQTII